MQKVLFVINLISISGWLANFKKTYRISSRKIVKFTTKSSVNSNEETEDLAIEFLLDFQDNIKPHFEEREVLNSDQSGFRYHHLCNRTLSHTNERTTSVTVDSMNSLTHSYTIQPILSMEGKLLSPMMIILQETTGDQFGPRVGPNLPRYSNLLVTCSKSGNSSLVHAKIFVENCLAPNIDTQCCFLNDSWTGQRDPKLYEISGKRLVVKTFPAGSTGYMQPLDIYCFHQFKDFIKRFNEHLLITSSEIQPFNRNTILKIQSLIHNQFQSNLFTPMFRYAWYKAGFIDEYIRFESIKEILFEFNQAYCSTELCLSEPFIQCAYCRNVLCIDCFFVKYHFH